jgi:adenine-specific DNA methylase
LRPEVIKAEGRDAGEAVLHMLAFVIDKLANWNSILSSWNAPARTARSVFDRHDFSFKPTWCEMAPCEAGGGLGWAIDNVVDAYEDIAKLCSETRKNSVQISLGSATNLPELEERSITAVVVDPPYADNVQYAELADFFYVWLKRMQGHRRPDWYSTKLCDYTEEAVVNISRFKDGKGRVKTSEAAAQAHAFYERKMTDVFKECNRILRDDGVLTVMFTHKKQEAWVSLFNSLIQSRFTITATWPVKTENEDSLHQARKNAAQSTVILVARKREKKAGTGYFGREMREEIRAAARTSAERFKSERLNPIDQLVGSFGPAMAVYSRYDEVRLDTGEPVGVASAIEEASDAVSQWRIEQLAKRGLDGVEPEGRFALLCWDVMGAAEFRFNEAKLLGHAVGMDVDRLITAGLVTKEGDKIYMVPARDRRRDKPLKQEHAVMGLFGEIPEKRRATKSDVLKIHPNDPAFRTTIDACHALALRYVEAHEGNAGIGNAKALATQQGWGASSNVARLMEALTHAAPRALWKDHGKNSPGAKFPEFRAWHALLQPLFGVSPPDWTEAPPPMELLPFGELEEELPDEDEEEEEEEE